MGIKLLDIVNLFKGMNKMNPLGGIHSSDAFRAVLERERSRSERTGQIFSLVIFGFNSGNGTGTEMLARLGNDITRKIRKSDEVGWYDENRIGTILIGTSAEGAWQFIEIIKKRIVEVEPDLICTVYSYPSPCIHSNVHGEDTKDQQTPSEHKMSFNAKANSSTVLPDNGKSVERLDILFARPIPIWKRLVDFFWALLFMILLSPLFLLIALFIKIVSPGPVFYRQERIGYLGRPFTFWKFRTMHANNDGTGHKRYLSHLIEGDAPMAKLDDGRDPRIIPFGKFLRYSCLDELPQLINVLRGDMSLVGPRPCLPYEADMYLRWHTRRFDTVPGMTGLWQVSGKNRLTFKEMIRLDIRYSRKMSPGLDAKILLLTGPAILGMVSEPLSRRTGVEQETAAFAPSRREQSARG